LITEQTREEMRTIMARYPQPRSALLPMLHLVQSAEGLISPEGIEVCAAELDITAAEVAAVATFYTMYKRRPTGDYLVSVCTNLSCGLRGGEEIYDCVSKHLGIGHNETTDDGRITLEHAECLAACDFAPVVTVNYEFYDDQTPATALDIVKGLQSGDVATPTRGELPGTFRDVSFELAGFVGAQSVDDVRADA